MFFLFTTSNELKRVMFGKKKKFPCTNCAKETTFYEANVRDDVKAFGVVELWKKTKRVMQCGECLMVGDFYQFFPDEKTREEKAQEQQKRKEAEAAQEATRAAEEEQRKQQEAERLKREEQRRATEAKVDDELSKLKKSLGKEAATDEQQGSSAS